MPQFLEILRFAFDIVKFIVDVTFKTVNLMWQIISFFIRLGDS
jgi:hypothetical protein